MTPEKPSPTNFTIDLTEQTSHYEDLSLNRTRTFSFQAPPQQTSEKFCQTFLQLYALEHVGKRVTDPNVIVLNSTQKEMVQTIVQSNKNRQDEKSKFLTQRANKFLKILWKAEKYSDSFMQQIEDTKPTVKVPRYASPIHNFKKHNLTKNNSFGTLSNHTEKTKSLNKAAKEKPKGINQVVTKPATKQRKQRDQMKQRQDKSRGSSRVRQFNSQDKTFERIRLSPRQQKAVLDRHPAKEQEKALEVDLTQNIALKTMLTTKNYQNMLKILQQ